MEKKTGQETAHIEDKGSLPPDDIPGIDEIDEKKLSFLDRTAIGNAKTFNMAKDLHLTDQQYLLCLTIFFIPYALFEPPSNVLLKRLTPRWWLSGIMFLWGVAMVAQGLVKDFGQLFAVRFLLGLFEAGLFPGVNYILSCWYPRNEFGTRASIFFSAATVSGALGGLLAAAISNMDGVGGKQGWSWIFIIEGLITIVAACLSPFFIHDFPDSARFLTPTERAFVIRRLQSDDIVSAGGENFHWTAIKASLTDYKTWLSMVVYMGIDGPLYAFSLFTPSIIKELGYTSVKANLISVPIYVFACIVTLFVGFTADRIRKRGMFNLIFLSVGMVGYIILIVSRKPALSYFAIYLAAAGIYPLIPNTVAWVSNNTEGSYKRSFTMAMVIGFGNLNGAVSSNIYRAKNSPWYTLGHGIVLLYIGLGFISTLTYMILLSRENKKRDRGERDEVIQGETVLESTGASTSVKGQTVYESSDQARLILGDKFSGYRYII